MTGTVLLVFAFVFFVIAAFYNPAAPTGPWYGRVHLGWLGLACWVAVSLFK
jgi:hypothetical protein